MGEVCEAKLDGYKGARTAESLIETVSVLREVR